MNTVKLKAITKPFDDCAPDSESLLAYFARVSSTANQSNHATGVKLIKSLIRRKEWSPLEMVSLTMEIVTTRDISRQILRHRSFSFQEFSQRYAELDMDPSYREAREKHPRDRQMSVDITNPLSVKRILWEAKQREIWKKCYAAYKHALALGIAKEQARALLPEGLTPTRLYMAGTLRSWLHWILLRSEMGTQKEHRILAEQAKEIILEQFPSLQHAFDK